VCDGLQLVLRKALAGPLVELRHGEGAKQSSRWLMTKDKFKPSVARCGQLHIARELISSAVTSFVLVRYIIAAVVVKDVFAAIVRYIAVHLHNSCAVHHPAVVQYIFTAIVQSIIQQLCSTSFHSSCAVHHPAIA
jgi:hypothetical protein